MTTTHTAIPGTAALERLKTLSGIAGELQDRVAAEAEHVLSVSAAALLPACGLDRLLVGLCTIEHGNGAPSQFLQILGYRTVTGDVEAVTDMCREIDLPAEAHPLTTLLEAYAAAADGVVGPDCAWRLLLTTVGAARLGWEWDDRVEHDLDLQDPAPLSEATFYAMLAGEFPAGSDRMTVAGRDVRVYSAAGASSLTVTVPVGAGSQRLDTLDEFHALVAELAQRHGLAVAYAPGRRLDVLAFAAVHGRRHDRVRRPRERADRARPSVAAAVPVESAAPSAARDWPATSSRSVRCMTVRATSSTSCSAVRRPSRPRPSPSGSRRAATTGRPRRADRTSTQWRPWPTSACRRVASAPTASRSALTVADVLGWAWRSDVAREFAAFLRSAAHRRRRDSCRSSRRRDGGRARAGRAVRPCDECPWRLDVPARRVPGDRRVRCTGKRPSRRGTCRSARRWSPATSRRRAVDVICAGWLAVEGHNHLGVRAARDRRADPRRGARAGPRAGRRSSRAWGRWCSVIPLPTLAAVTWRRARTRAAGAPEAMTAGAEARFIYAGIGSRKTPADILALMAEIAGALAARGWTLRLRRREGRRPGVLRRRRPPPAATPSCSCRGRAFSRQGARKARRADQAPDRRERPARSRSRAPSTRYGSVCPTPSRPCTRATAIRSSARWAGLARSPRDLLDAGRQPRRLQPRRRRHRPGAADRRRARHPRREPRARRAPRAPGSASSTRPPDADPRPGGACSRAPRSPERTPPMRHVFATVASATLTVHAA